MSAKQSIHIDAPVAKVFEFCADPRASWSTGPGALSNELVDVRRTEEGVGTYYTWRTTFAGLRVQGFDVYTEYVKNKAFTDRSSFSLAGTWTYTFERDGSGTLLTVQRHPGSIWAFGPLDRLADRLVVASLTRKTLENVKKALESPTAAAAQPAAAGGPTR